MAPRLLVTTLAEYQTRFWIPVVKALARRGRHAVLLAFDQRSAEMAAREGVAVVEMYRTDPTTAATADDPAAFADRLRVYGMDGGNLWFSHERITFGLRDTAALRRRFVAYADAMEAVIHREGAEAALVQELGGFVSVIAAFHAARRRGVRNWFIEPSFFRGRLFFTPDSFAAPQTMASAADAVSAEALAYITRARATQAIVIPEKDRHQYAAAFQKVANARNARRLVEKLWDQVALGKHQEFGHNVHHAVQHARMAINAVRLRPAYGGFPARPFVYYPLHVPADMALTLRSPEYFDQFATIDFLLRTLPDGFDLVIKEHPAQIGAISPGRVAELRRRFDNFVVLPPQTNNYTVLGKAAAVVTVNSKSGAEALLLGRPVVVLGDAFYRTCPLVFAADRLADTPAALRRALAAGAVDPAAVARHFETAWRLARPGELYVDGAERVETFTASLLDALARA